MVKSAAVWAETGLKRGQKILRLDKKRETSKHETLKEFGDTRGQIDRTKRRRSVCGFARFVHRIDGRRFPSGGKRMSGPGEVEDEEQERQSNRGKMLEERVRDAIRTGSRRGRKTRDSCGELRQPKRRAKRSVVRRHTGRGAELTKKAPSFMATDFKRGAREVAFKKRSITSGQILV